MTEEDFTPITIAQYAAQAALTDQHSDGGSLAFPLLGLFGEAGSLLSEVKKKQRDRASYRGYAGAVVEEFGDVLWYLAAVASRVGVPLSDIFAAAAPMMGSDGAVTFVALQPAVMPRAGDPTVAFERTLLKLAGEIGLLVTDLQEQGSAECSAISSGRLSTIAETLIKAANETGVTLEAAAVKNLAKISDRWPRERHYPAPLDADAEAEERFPRRLIIEIFERRVPGRSSV